jgi:hypothetical protein
MIVPGYTSRPSLVPALCTATRLGSQSPGEASARRGQSVSQIRTGMFRGQRRLLCISDYCDVITDFGTADHYDDGRAEEVNEYLALLQARELPLTSVATEAVVQAYLTKAPPFGSGGKRHEFKDAIVLHALEVWGDDDERVYVISNDTDMASFCAASPTLVHLPSIGAFTDLVLRHDAALARNALDALQRQTATIITQSAALFEDMTFFVADYHDEEVTITEVTVGEPDEPELLEINDEEARFQVFTTVAFVASVAADDPNTGYYDREEGAIYCMDRIHQSVAGDIEVTITGRITNFANDPEHAVVTCEDIYNESTHDNVIILHLDDEDER